METCKWCGYPIQVKCEHGDCRRAYARGFDTLDCMEAYDKKRLMDLDHQRRSA